MSEIAGISWRLPRYPLPRQACSRRAKI